MANRLKMAKIHSIQTLRTQGWSQRRIARALDVDRETVARYVRAAEGPQNQPNPPTGSEGPRAPPGGGQNQPNPPLGSTGPVSQCEPFRELIRGGLERGLSAQRICQDLQSEQGFGYGLHGSPILSQKRRFLCFVAPEPVPGVLM